MSIRIFICLLLTFFWGQLLHADERILSYDVYIKIRGDGSIFVQEYIKVVAEGKNIRRGIYRDIPTRYKNRYGKNTVVHLDVVWVKRDDKDEPWFSETLDNGIRINTGNDDFLTLPGEYTYSIAYLTNRQLGFFKDHDELYWNAIGTGWVFPIEAATVRVELPENVPQSELKAEAYTGPQGAKGQDYEASITAADAALWHLTRPLQPGEGMTIVLSFPKGIVEAPDFWTEVKEFVKYNKHLAIIAVTFFVLSLYLLMRWYLVGRDPKPGIIIPRYSPPPGLGHADLGYIMGMAHNTQCLTADLVNMAISGHIKINKTGSSWVIEKCSASGAQGRLSKSQSVLFKALFEKADSVEINKKNQVFLAGIISKHEESLSNLYKEKMFKSNQSMIDNFLVVTALFIIVIVAAFSDVGVLAIYALSGLWIVIYVVYALVIPAPTMPGRKIMDHIEGFKLYLSVAEKDELARLGAIGTAPQVDGGQFERLLPYAIALGVEEAWASKLIASIGAAAAQEVTSSFGWYQGSSRINVNSFASNLGSSLSSSIASSAQAPGSSSGSGGGGSSGGGGGGGGGGGR
jgi:uncharacterized membrane protein YgcG